jgi:ADP-ribosylglycohydrolase
MRAAPVGAYFADDVEAVIENAKLSAEITHAHPEGIAGAIAVAIATAVAWHLKAANQHLKRPEFIEQILPHVPASEVRDKIQRAGDIAANTSIDHVVAILGNGYQVTAQDTVPFVIWSAGENLDDFEQAIWQTASALGDVDTTCAMVGGIVSMYNGIEGIPAEWIGKREPLPKWALED